MVSLAAKDLFVDGGFGAKLTPDRQHIAETAEPCRFLLKILCVRLQVFGSYPRILENGAHDVLRPADQRINIVIARFGALGRWRQGSQWRLMHPMFELVSFRAE